MRNFSLHNDSNVFIVAELSANHNQDYGIALDSIKAAKDAGANAIKLQTFRPDTITIDSNKKYFQLKHDTIWDGITLFQLYEQAYTPWEWQPKLKKFAEDLGLICFSSPFDKSAVDFLEKMDVSVYKIASFEITDIPLIKYVASKGKPVILSTGIATLSEIDEAVTACRTVRNDDIALLKCTSAYPAPIEEANLLTIPHLKDTFNVVTGLSDHTLGYAAAAAAVALGAKIIEKHFILDRKLGGPDSSFSIEPDEFKEMVDIIRDVEKSLGKIDYQLSSEVQKNRIFTRSLFVVKNVKAGERISEDNVRSIRPCYGLHPKYYNIILGQKFRVNIESGTPLEWRHFE